jgi:SAM-dependent methyltransferase
MPANLNPSFRQKLRIIRYGIETRGFVRTLVDTAIYFLSYSPITDRSFDRKYGTDTSGILHPDTLAIQDSLARKEANVYLASPEKVTTWMLKRLPINHADYSFVDFGCGKGRVLLVASQFPFRQVLGVEIAEQLVAVARSNIAQFAVTGRPSCKKVTVVQADVRSVVLPPGDLVLHFYSPFKEKILDEVLGHIEKVLTVSGAQAFIPYLCPTGAEIDIEPVFQQHPTFHQYAYYQSPSGSYDWLFYMNKK